MNRSSNKACIHPRFVICSIVNGQLVLTNLLQCVSWSDRKGFNSYPVIFVPNNMTLSSKALKPGIVLTSLCRQDLSGIFFPPKVLFHPHWRFVLDSSWLSLVFYQMVKKVLGCSMSALAVSALHSNYAGWIWQNCWNHPWFVVRVSVDSSPSRGFKVLKILSALAYWKTHWRSFLYLSWKQIANNFSMSWTRPFCHLVIMVLKPVDVFTTSFTLSLSFRSVEMVKRTRFKSCVMA